MIRSLVFDIGQVLVDFNWEAYIESLGFGEEKTRRLKSATVLSGQWTEQDRGSYTKEELIRLFMGEDPGLEEELELFFDRIEEIVEERDYAAALLQSIKKEGYQVYLLSNYGKYAFEIASKKFHFLEYADGKIISYQISSTKPEEKIYYALLKKYQLKPEECLFLDDREENIRAAEKIGFRTILFHDIQQALSEMRQKGVKADY